jgi:DNA-binding NarL/FixJ family response regulator
MIRVPLVDDQELVRAGLRGILRETFGFEIAGECADGSKALAAIRQSNPDIVLMDVRTARDDGVAATRLLRAEWPTLPVLALTTFDDDEALAGMLRAGAAGFVLKGARRASGRAHSVDQVGLRISRLFEEVVNLVPSALTE